MEKRPESDLYSPVRDYLQGLGYDVKGEVKGCDVTATRDGELIVVELKRGFTLELLYQAVDRQRVADGHGSTSTTLRCSPGKEATGPGAKYT